MTSILSSMVFARGGALVKRMAMAWAFKAGVAVMALLAVQFGLLAAFFAFWPRFGPVDAALILCGALAIMAVILFIAAKILASRSKRRAQAMAAEAALAPILIGLSKRAPALLVLALVVSGMLIASRKD